ncbi:NAD-binding protein [Methylocucumis oryzae]|uniref:NAD-binding protein n=1 Tax=Methylocucumis oryzae TaxID=1632867 RepID=UPI000AAA6777|nr:NAD-binding protein [Methylocucumis oryzae]
MAAIFRHGTPVVVSGESIIETDDEVFFVAPRDEVRTVLKELNKLEEPIKRIIIAGGGHVGKRLGMALEKNHQVKIIEKDPRRVKAISESLNNTTILVGDCADQKICS